MPVVPPDGDFQPLTAQPVPLKRVDPVYPKEMLPRGFEATVWLKVLVGTDGKVKKAEVLKSGNAILNEPAIAAAKQWVFSPGRLGDKPVEVWAALPFRFISPK
jgi:periplasmic protein TonB